MKIGPNDCRAIQNLRGGGPARLEEIPKPLCRQCVFRQHMEIGSHQQRARLG